MSLFLILFLLSLAGIVFIITRKVVLLKKQPENILVEENLFIKIINPERLKNFLTKGLKNFLHASIWVILRNYIVLTNFLKNKIKELFKKIEMRIKKMIGHKSTEKRGESRYLKIISEYRQKINRIKHRIKEEEGIK